MGSTSREGKGRCSSMRSDMERRLQGLEDKMPPSRADPPLKSRPMTRAVSFTNARLLCRGPQRMWEIGVIGGSCQTGTAAPAGSAPRRALQQILEQSWHCRICLPPWTCSATPLRAFLPTKKPGHSFRAFRQKTQGSVGGRHMYLQVLLAAPTPPTPREDPGRNNETLRSKLGA